MIDAFLCSRKCRSTKILTPHPCSVSILDYNKDAFSVLFIIFISDFLSNSIKRFKFANDSSELLSGQTIIELLKDICLGIKLWSGRWRMAINGSKTNILPFTNSQEDFTQIKLNGEKWKISENTKSLGFIIDSKVNYKQHTDISDAKDTRNWHVLRKHHSTKWGITSPNQFCLHRSVILPQVLNGAPKWSQKNIKSLPLFQNNIPRSIEKTVSRPLLIPLKLLQGCHQLTFSGSQFFFKSQKKTYPSRLPTTKEYNKTAT